MGVPTFSVTSNIIAHNFTNLSLRPLRRFRIGVNGFENPLRDPKTAEFKLQIGAGCKMKMDETGNILIKRFSDRNVFVKNILDDEGSAISNDILKMPQGTLEMERPVKLFDMKKFQQVRKSLNCPSHFVISRG